MPKNYFKYNHTQCVQEVRDEAPVFQQGNCIRGLLEKYLTIFFYANTLWIII